MLKAKLKNCLKIYFVLIIFSALDRVNFFIYEVIPIFKHKFYKYQSKFYLLCLLLTLISSCTVTNNLYVSDPVPIGKGNTEIYVGIANGDIYYSNDLSLAPNLCFGGVAGIGEQITAKCVFHLPYFIGGFGLHAGIQYSFFKKWTLFNAALGVNAGYTLAKDTLNLGFTKIALEPDAKGVFEGNIFLPVSYNFNNDSRIIFTSRLSYYSINVKKNIHNSKDDKTQNYNVFYPSFSLGARLNKLYLEATAQYIDNVVRPGFGIVFSFNGIDGENKIEK